MNRRIWLGLMVLIMLLAACGSDDGSTPDEQVIIREEVTLTRQPSPTQISAAPTLTPNGPTLTPSPTVPLLITLTPSVPPPPPTDTPIPTETPNFREYVVQAGDDCIGIAADFGHLDLGSVSAIEQLNGIRCSALSQGSTIKVPLPTPTATEVGMDLTQTAVATSAPPQMALDTVDVYAVQEYTVVEGDTIQGVAFKNSTTMQRVCELNPLPEGLNCGGCRWEAGQFICPSPPIMVIGQRLSVPAPTPTPTASPTFTGSETPTLTPTYRAPEPIAPHEGDTVQGPVRLVWLTVGVLNAGESYFVRLHDETTGQVFESVTRQLSLDVPLAYLPNDGQAHVFTWQVQVVRMVDGIHSLPISQAVAAQRFTWQGWE